MLCALPQAVSHEQDLIIPVPKERESESLSSSISLSVTEADREEESLIESVPSVAEMQRFLYSLPRNLHWDKDKSKDKLQLEQQENSQQTSDPPLNVLEELDEEGMEDDEDKKKDAAEAGLEIAWQYRLSVQQERLAQAGGSTRTKSSAASKSKNVFCHSYDLSARMQDQEHGSSASSLDLLTSSHHVVGVRCCQEDPAQSDRHSPLACGIHLFRELVKIIEERRTKVKNNVVRILLYHPAQLETLTVALPLLLSHVRQSNLPVVVMVVIKPPLSLNSSIIRVQSTIERVADVVLKTEGFSSRREYPPPPEFRDLQGLLTIVKASTVTAATANGSGHYGDLTTSKRPAAYVYGLKRDRRKLHIPLLHIPPEDYAQGGGSTGGVRSGAGRVEIKKKSSGSSTMGCSSNLSGSVLDF